MTKGRRDIGEEIRDGLRELKRGDYGRVINVPDVTGIREGRRAPSGAARTLVLVAARNPEALLEVA